MKTLSRDTCAEIELFHVELLRKASIQKRIEMTNSLIKATRQLSWLGICDRYPEDSMEERIERFIMLLYGDRIMAQKVRDLLTSRNRVS